MTAKAKKTAAEMVAEIDANLTDEDRAVIKAGQRAWVRIQGRSAIKDALNKGSDGDLFRAVEDYKQSQITVACEMVESIIVDDNGQQIPLFVKTEDNTYCKNPLLGGDVTVTIDAVELLGGWD